MFSNIVEYISYTFESTMALTLELGHSRSKIFNNLLFQLAPDASYFLNWNIVDL